MAALISGALAASVGLILGGELAVLQAPIFDSLSSDCSARRTFRSGAQSRRAGSNFRVKPQALKFNIKPNGDNEEDRVSSINIVELHRKSVLPILPYVIDNR